MRPLVAALLLAASPSAAAPPTLSGIVVGGEARVALLKPADGGTVEVREGETVAGFAVRRILPDSVLLNRAPPDGDGEPIELTFGASRPPLPVDRGGPTFGLVVNPPMPAPD